jgi:pimeloyl-ACP methyl ester carboxylesterase
MKLLVVHDVGDASPAERWAPLVDGWDGPTLLPLQPGHGDAPPPEGGNYGSSDAAIIAARAMVSEGWTDPWPVVVGQGWGAYAAELLAMAGRAGALVLVDGLGGPWCDADGFMADQRRWLHEVVSDIAALAWPASSPDPRLAHRFPTVWERAHTAARRAAITVPVAAIETPASPTPDGERARRVAQFGGTAALHEVEALDMGAVLAVARAIPFH